MVITGDMKMADVVMLDIQLLTIIQRLNIPLGFREKTVKEVCQMHGIDENFFVQLTNASYIKDYAPKEHQLTYQPECIINYLQNTHKDFLTYRIPSIEQQIIELEKTLESPTNSALLLNFFREYIKEFQSHLDMEERTVFPYTLALSNCIKQKKITDEFASQFGQYGIDRYKTEHSDIEEKVDDLKNILIKYLPPPADNRKYYNLIHDIFHLEKELNDHTELENKVLAPLVKMMEKELKKYI